MKLFDEMARGSRNGQDWFARLAHHTLLSAEEERALCEAFKRETDHMVAILGTRPWFWNKIRDAFEDVLRNGGKWSEFVTDLSRDRDPQDASSSGPTPQRFRAQISRLTRLDPRKRKHRQRAGALLARLPLNPSWVVQRARQALQNPVISGLSEQHRGALIGSLARWQGARDQLVRRNMRLVMTIAKKYLGRRVPFADLMEEGVVGLCLAIDRYRPGAGARFGTYAYRWIDETIHRAVMNHSRTIRIPINGWRRMYAIARARAKLARDGTAPHEVPIEEVAQAVGRTVHEVVCIEDAFRIEARPMLSLDDPIEIGEPEGTTRGMLLSDLHAETPEHGLMRAERGVEIHRAVAVLHPEERLVVLLRLDTGGRSRTLEDVAHLAGPLLRKGVRPGTGRVTRQRAQQIEESAFKHLRHHPGLRALFEEEELPGVP